MLGQPRLGTVLTQRMLTGGIRVESARKHNSSLLSDVHTMRAFKQRKSIQTKNMDEKKMFGIFIWMTQMMTLSQEMYSI